MITKLKSGVPWQFKIFAKIVLSRLPFNYAIWKKFNIFSHGSMEQPAYAYDVFKKHYNRFMTRKNRNSDTSFVMLELGPGDSLFSCMIAHGHGASRSYLVDVAPFVQNTLQPYFSMAEYLESKGIKKPGIDTIRACHSLKDVLDICSSSYLTDGLLSLQSIPDSSVDFIWSQAVLEHIRRDEFLPIMKEMRRILRSDGICSHTVDLRDHLGGYLNHLRFSYQVWESNFMVNSGFYTNRIQFSQMLSMFQQAGFAFSLESVKGWEHLPTPRSKMSKEFQHLSEEELCISEFDVILSPS